MNQMTIIDEASTVPRDRGQEMLQHMARVQIEATIKRHVDATMIKDVHQVMKAQGQTSYTQLRRHLKSHVSLDAMAAAGAPIPDRCFDHVRNVVTLAYAPYGTRH